jgi:hypothetical protein
MAEAVVEHRIVECPRGSNATRAADRNGPAPRRRAGRRINAEAENAFFLSLEGEKRPVTDATPLARRTAHHYQHRLELSPTTLLIELSLGGQALCSISEGCRLAASERESTTTSPPVKRARARARRHQLGEHCGPARACRETPDSRP